MRFSELIFFVALFGIPLWLLLRAWSRYFALDRSLGSAWLRMQTGLILVSVSTIMWIAVFALMILEDYNSEAKSIARNVSPGPLELINLLFCAGALVCSGFWRRSDPQSARLRGAIAVSSACLMLIWLILAANPH